VLSDYKKLFRDAILVMMPPPTGKDRMSGDLRELIAVSHGAEAADAWRKFEIAEADKIVLGEAGKRVLHLFSGQQAGQCALMSAVCLGNRTARNATSIPSRWLALHRRQADFR
jgi:hypothetical protein